IDTAYNHGEVIGQNGGLKDVFNLISRVAVTDSTVMILGESGTGKELVARAIHNASLRKDKMLVKVNCAALPASLIESELFGHEKGSFTGANERRIGKFELAHNSTIFLDEIGELPPDLQVKLLRVIQEKEIERVGGHQTIKTDVRIIAATNRNLLTEIGNGGFRADLFYRLNVFPINLPPLRERAEDIPLLITHYINKFAQKFGKRIDKIADSVLKQMIAYSWPGNVRELEHLIERSVLMTTGNTLKEMFLPKAIPVSPPVDKVPASEVTLLDECERRHIIHVLKHTAGRVKGPGGAAEILGLPSTTLHSRMKKLKIEKADI
ncbi:MAG TPA: sigma 54-interacting transcriptional regulator, partial [Mucilaginibacter sp.]